MKKCILGVLMIFAGACQKQEYQPKCTSIYQGVVIDVTDPLKFKPNAEMILSSYDFIGDGSKAAQFHLEPISDKRLNICFDFYLPDSVSASRLNFNEDIHFRDNYISGFCDSITHSFYRFYSLYDTSHSLNKSECYRTIAGAIIRARQTGASNILIYVYSDLQENSDIYNCYLPQNQILLSKNPNRVADLFQEAYGLPTNLENVKVYFMYRPSTSDEDRRYFEMLNVYKSLLEQRHVSIHIQANNNCSSL